MKALWESKYKPADTVTRTKITSPSIAPSATTPSAITPSATAPSAIAPSKKKPNQYAEYLNKYKAKVLAQLDDTANSKDKYDRYIKEKVELVKDPIA